MTAVLAIIGDRYHDPDVLRAGLAPLACAGFELRVVERPGEIPWDELDRFRAVLVAKGGYNFSETPGHLWLAGGEAERLRAFVAGGSGLLCLHSGVAGYDVSPVMLELARAAFVNHPPGLVAQRLESLGGAPFADAGEFATEDEQYSLRFTGGDTTVFLQNRSELHGVSAAGWSHRCGSGRVVCLTPGHTLPVLANPVYQRWLAAALRWCAA
jgi:hypothetical protein